jgi:6-phosphogluconate dehydrogenase
MIKPMQIGMVGLGRMGANMVRRIGRAGHSSVVYDHNTEAVTALVAENSNGGEIVGATSLVDLVAQLQQPRVLWLMLPAAIVDGVIEQLLPLLAPGDTIIDGGNSFYGDDLTRAAKLASHGLDYLDVGTSGGIWGLERGYCLMIGGPAAAFARLEPIFAALAPGVGAAPRQSQGEGEPGQNEPSQTEPSQAEQGYLHCGPAGAGHFVKMVHNGIEYGLMAAYAEGFNILKHANAGLTNTQQQSAENTPLRQPERYQYNLDIAAIAEVWRRGSVVGSWLLDLTAKALGHDNELTDFSGRISDSGEGRWTLQAAVETAVPAPVLSAALFARFSSRGQDDYAEKLLSAMRLQFGGHSEQK